MTIAARDLSAVLSAAGVTRADWSERSDYTYAYIRILAWSEAYVWAQCLLRYGNRLALKAFRSTELQSELRALVAQGCFDALAGEGLLNFAVRNGRIEAEKCWTPHTDFTREHPLRFETAPVLSEQTKRAEAELVARYRGEQR
jgi:hypothetical protein